MISLTESKTKQNKKNKLMDSEDRWIVASGWGWGVGEVSEGHKLPVIK